MVLAEGEGVWRLEGKDTPARKGDAVYAAPWTEHGIRSSGERSLTYYMVKWSGKGVSVPEEPAPTRR